LARSTIVSGGGDIAISGDGGIAMEYGGQIRAGGAGSVSLVGEQAAYNGIYLGGQGVSVRTGAGHITLTGSGVSYAVRIDGGAEVNAGGAGRVRISVVASTQLDYFGINIAGSTVVAHDGDIRVTGVTGGGDGHVPY